MKHIYSNFYLRRFKTIVLILIGFIMTSQTMMSKNSLSIVLSIDRDINFAFQEVKGTVVDASGEPLPGATVIIKDTTTGTQTDFDGQFTLNIQPGQIISISYIGFETQEIVYAGQETIDVTLLENSNDLDEVVVIGYGTKKKSEISSSVSKVKSEEIEALPSDNVLEALDGRTTGVRVLASGEPGAEANVLIRGINTFGNARPLIVVDGVFVESINSINPASIESVDVLKDAAAAAIYGSRGTNGVIIITTKKGQIQDNGKSKFSFKTYSGIQYLADDRFYDVITGRQLYEIGIAEDLSPDFASQPNTNVGNSPNRFFLSENGVATDVLDPNFVPANTDWLQSIYKNSAPITNYDIGVSGGGGIGNYRLQLGYFNRDGIQIETGLERYSLNLNSNFKISDKFTISQNLNVGLTEFKRPVVAGGRSLQDWATYSVPYLPIQDDQGRFFIPDGNNDRILQSENPVFLSQLADFETRRRAVNGGFTSNYEFFKGFRNITTLGAYSSTESTNFIQFRISPANVNGVARDINQRVRRQRIEVLNTNASTNFNFNRNFSGHGIDASLIFEISTRERDQVDIQQTSENTADGQNVIVDGQRSVASTLIFPEKLISQAFRLGYDFKGKYLLSGSIRRDRSSLLSSIDDNNIGYFPAASAAWVVSNENFLRTSNLISNLKLKGSYGTTGNNSAVAFSSVTNLLNDTAVVFANEENPLLTLRPDTFSSPNLTWELSVKQNYGIELGLWGDKVTFGAEYFKSVNEDLIVREPVSISFGVNQDPFRNVGEVQTDGIELTLGLKDQSKKFKWSIDANITFLNQQVNRVNSSSGNSALAGGQSRNFNNQFLNIIQVGEPLYGLQGLKTDGLFRSLDELKQGPLQEQRFRDLTDSDNNTNSLTREIREENGVRTFIFTRNDGRTVAYDNVTVDPDGTFLGDIRYQDINNNGIVNASDDGTTIGDPNPDFTGAVNFSFNYKGFDFNAFFTGVYGNDVFNATRRGLLAFNGVGNADISILDRYRPAADPRDIPRLQEINPSLIEANTDTDVPRFDVGQERNTFASDRFIEDGSYLRLKNITLGYSVPKKALEKLIKLSKFRIYASAQNLYTWTNYTGIDPEIQPAWSSRIQSVGVDEGFVPSPTTITAGLEVEF